MRVTQGSDDLATHESSPQTFRRFSTMRRQDVLRVDGNGLAEHTSCWPRSTIRSIVRRRADRLRRVAEITGAIEQRVDRLLAMSVRDPQRLSFTETIADHGLRAGISTSRTMRAPAELPARSLHRSFAGLAEMRRVVLEGAGSFRSRGPAQIVGRGPGRVKAHDLGAALRIALCGIERMRAVRQRVNRSISARRSTKSPLARRGADQTNFPSASMATGAKKLTQGCTSRRSSPSLFAARMKLSRVLRKLPSPYFLGWSRPSSRPPPRHAPRWCPR